MPSIYSQSNLSNGPTNHSCNGKTFPSWWKESEKVRQQLPSDFAIRPLEAEDFDRGFLDCLGQLTLVGKITRAEFLDRFEYMRVHEETYMPVVIINETRNRVVACGTLLIERKFIHQCALLAHIEDIVVDGSERGRGLGRLMIAQLEHLAFKAGCYKITLDCDDKNQGFYGKSAFEKKGLQMCIYYRDDPATTPTSPKYPLYQLERPE